MTFEPVDEWFDAAAVWSDGDASVTYACPTCAEAQPSPNGTGHSRGDSAT
jgi:hypothetical protein